jgi:hypothetical protein
MRTPWLLTCLSFCELLYITSMLKVIRSNRQPRYDGVRNMASGAGKLEDLITLVKKWGCALLTIISPVIKLT